jgi:hypothetical protein
VSSDPTENLLKAIEGRREELIGGVHCSAEWWAEIETHGRIAHGSMRFFVMSDRNGPVAHSTAAAIRRDVLIEDMVKSAQAMALAAWSLLHRAA